jgi:hypothetical protein
MKRQKKCRKLKFSFFIFRFCPEKMETPEIAAPWKQEELGQVPKKDIVEFLQKSGNNAFLQRHGLKGKLQNVAKNVNKVPLLANLEKQLTLIHSLWPSCTTQGKLDAAYADLFVSKVLLTTHRQMSIISGLMRTIGMCLYLMDGGRTSARRRTTRSRPPWRSGRRRRRPRPALARAPPPPPLAPRVTRAPAGRASVDTDRLTCVCVV